MLEGVLVVGYVVVVVVGVSEEIVVPCEDVGRADVEDRQTDFLRLFDGHHLFRIVIQVLADFVS